MSKWSASAEQIGERLLTRPNGAVNERELAAETGWSQVLTRGQEAATHLGTTDC